MVRNKLTQTYARPTQTYAWSLQRRAYVQNKTYACNEIAPIKSMTYFCVGLRFPRQFDRPTQIRGSKQMEADGDLRKTYADPGRARVSGGGGAEAPPTHTNAFADAPETRLTGLVFCAASPSRRMVAVSFWVLPRPSQKLRDCPRAQYRQRQKFFRILKSEP